MKINLVVIQPQGYIHSLGFLDYAYYFKYHLSRFNFDCVISKNRFKRGELNIIFGAHLLKDTFILRQYNCCIINLENLSESPSISPQYLDILKLYPILDYSSRNVDHIKKLGGISSVFSFGFCPFDFDYPKLQKKYDFLFYGSMNDQRRNYLRELGEKGLRVSLLAFGVYFHERNRHILSSRFILNCHFYQNGLFEQARVFVPLSLGVPVLSMPSDNPQSVPRVFKDSVLWLTEDLLQRLATPGFLESTELENLTREKLIRFQSESPDFREQGILEFLAGVSDEGKSTFRLNKSGDASAEAPRQLHIGSGKNYLPGWLNVDVDASTAPDILLDLTAIKLPLTVETSAYGSVTLEQGYFNILFADNVLEHVPDLVGFMTNCLDLLKIGGVFVIEVPYERALGAWQDPTHIRAFNENSFLYYTDWFWYLNWFESRFKIERLEYVNLKKERVSKESADSIYVKLIKVNTSDVEKALARTMSGDFKLEKTN